MFCSLKKIRDKYKEIKKYNVYICERYRSHWGENDGDVVSKDIFITSISYYYVYSKSKEKLRELITNAVDKKIKTITKSTEDKERIINIVLEKILKEKQIITENLKQQERQQEEQKKRKNKIDDSMKLKAEIIKQGYRVLAKKYHLDIGGSDEKMQLLNKAKEELLQVYRG